MLFILWEITCFIFFVLGFRTLIRHLAEFNRAMKNKQGKMAQEKMHLFVKGSFQFGLAMAIMLNLPIIWYLAGK